MSRREAREQRDRDARRAAVPPSEAREVLPHTVPLPIVTTAGVATAGVETARAETAASAIPPAEPALFRSQTSELTSARTPAPIRVGARRPVAAASRRAARTAELMDPRAAPARHARAPRTTHVGVVAGLAVVASLVLGSTATVTAALTDQPVVTAAEAPAITSAPVSQTPEARLSVPLPAQAESIPAPTVEAVTAALDLCAVPAFTAALAAGDDAAAISAAGGAEAFRASVAGGTAACVALDDPARVWVVVNKTRATAPVDYEPAAVALPDGVRSIEGGSLRSDAAAALTAMVGAAAAAGVGEIALQSGYRSYQTQQTTYANQVGAQGAAEADLSSARPGFSEHQSGLAGDLVACAESCGTLDDLAASAQGAWIVEHAWEYGWVTRYEDGFTAITGYSPEPWHLRYIGPELARAYHDGGWHTLEEFFGLPAAPTYVQ